MIKKLTKLIRNGLILVTVLSLFSCFVITQPFVQGQPATLPAVNIHHLEQHVRFLSETVHPRSFMQPDNLNAAADYVLTHFRQYSARTTEQTFIVDEQPYRNIITRFGSAEGQAIIVGAHYDSYSDTPGADDNASGVAGLLELARLLYENPPKQPIELVAYSLEEPPFFRTQNMGSAIHADSLVDSQQDIQLMIVLEMIGYFSQQANSQNYPISLLNVMYPTEGNYIAVVGRFAEISAVRTIKAAMSGATTLPVYSINAPQLIEGLDFSDHHNYWSRDFPAVMITDTAFYRNHHYHQLTDTADTLDYQKMANIVQGVYAALLLLNNPTTIQ